MNLRKKNVHIIKFLLINHVVEEATWESEDKMHAKHPFMFGKSSFVDKTSFEGVEM